MKEEHLDSLDRRLIRLLSEDGRMPAGKIAESLDVTPPTVRARITSLIRSGVLRIAGLVDAFKAKYLTIVIVGICLEMHEQLEEKIEQISNLSQVHWAAVVTGRYDIIVEVVFPDGMAGLYRFLLEDLPRLGGIRSSESFAVIKSKGKWVLLPPDLDT